MDDAFGLYLVMTDPVAGYETCAAAAVRCGVRYLQLRMKGTLRDAVLETARRVRAITLGSDTLFIVNDDVTIAREVDADGVHLGQGDLPSTRRGVYGPRRASVSVFRPTTSCRHCWHRAGHLITSGSVRCSPRRPSGLRPGPRPRTDGVDRPIVPCGGSCHRGDRPREPRGSAAPRRPELLRREGGQPVPGSGTAIRVLQGIWRQKSG